MSAQDAGAHSYACVTRRFEGDLLKCRGTSETGWVSKDASLRGPREVVFRIWLGRYRHGFDGAVRLGECTGVRCSGDR